MKEIEDNISVLVQNHFPDFYKEEGESFIAFVKAYYEWAQETNNHIYFSRNLLELRDIDKTINDFLVHFKEKYLVEAPVFYDTTRFNVKHSLDFYRSKGTERGTKLLFQEVWGLSDVDIYFPGRDVIRASDGQWYIPRYLEVSISDKTNSFVAKQITGSASGATAFVEGVNRKVISGKYLDIVYLSNIKGNFVLDDIITVDGDLTGCPVVVGSMTNVSILDAGRNFSVGDVLDVISNRTGKQGKVRVDSIEDSTGRVTFTLVDGGTGYRISTTPVVAEKMLQISNVASSCTFIDTFLVDETVIQPLSNITFFSSNTFFNIGSLVTGANSTANVATGRVVGTTQTQLTGLFTANSTSNVVVGTNTSFLSQLEAGDSLRFQSCTTIFVVDSVANNTSLELTTNGPNINNNTAVLANGSILVISGSGNFNNADRIASSSALIASVQDRTATGRVIGVNTGFIGLTSVSNTFTSNGFNYIYGSTSNVYANVALVGTGSGANIGIGSLTDEETVFLNTDLLSDNNSITTTILAGTVSANSTSPQVNGVSTTFANDLYHGAYVKFSGNSQIFQVNAVSNDTVLTLTTNGPNVVANTLSITNGEFLALPLDAFKYGFPKRPTANLSTILNLALTSDSFQIGTIASLTSVNPGTGYNISPFVLIRDTELAAFNRRDLSVGITNTAGVFVVGEELTQDFTTPSFTLQLSGSNTPFSTNETVTQQINATSNGYGSVTSANTTLSVVSTDGSFVNSSLSSALSGTVTSNNTSANVIGSSTSFTTELQSGDYIKFSGNSLILQVESITNNTLLTLTSNGVNVTGNDIFIASNVAVGLTSGVGFFVNNAIQNNQISISRGTVLNVSNTSLAVKRKTFNQTFTPNVQITGSISGATADVTSVTQIGNSSLMGYNANVNTFAGLVSGSLSSVSVIDSGFGYENGEVVTLTSPDSEFVATGFANLVNQGEGEGYFLSTRGFLNSDKYIHDGLFYQSYSYQVKAGVPLEVYGETLKKLCHVAGTILFGNVNKTSQVQLNITTSGVQIET